MRITSQVEITLGLCQAGVAMEIRVLLSPDGAQHEVFWAVCSHTGQEIL